MRKKVRGGGGEMGRKKDQCGSEARKDEKKILMIRIEI